MIVFIQERLKCYAQLMRLDRPIGIYLLGWPVLWALWVAAAGQPRAKILLIFLVGIVLMRSAGCIINDLADRQFDGKVERTKQRPLVVGSVSVIEAWVLFGLLLGAAFLLVLLLNRLTIILACVAVVFAVVYPFTKRVTYWPQLILGVAFAWGIPMVFAAQTGGLAPVCWLLFVIAMLWSLAYDTMYAMTDREDDLRIGLKSTAIWFADSDRLAIGVTQLAVLLLLCLLGWSQGLSGYYYGSVCVAAGIAIYQQHLLRGRDSQKSFQAFLTNHWFGLVVFGGLFLSHLPT